MTTLVVSVSRAADGLKLCDFIDGLQEENHLLRAQCAALSRRVCSERTGTAPYKISMDSDLGAFYYNFYVANDVVLAMVCENAASRSRSMATLQRLQGQFEEKYGDRVASADHPYGVFQAFEEVVEAELRKSASARGGSGQRDFDSVTAELSDVHRIMSDNIANILQRGEKIATVTERTESLFHHSQTYEKRSRQLLNELWWRRVLVMGGIGGLVVVVIALRWFVW